MQFKAHTKEESLRIIQELVARFKQNEKSYTSTSYDESNTRTDFIDKFFEALNWDVRNDNGFAERFREVVREDKVVINGQTKAPDYSFRLGGQKIFFVEAKKPSVNIKDDTAPSFQLRRYAYTAKLPLSILTDFEEFAVFDTKIKPNPNDKASAARIQYMRYHQYEENFEYLWNTFSKDAVQTGSFDRYCESGKNKRGTSEIDNELLSTIEKWRLDLAKNIALRNPALTLRNLNIAVQKIIDRIIFLRIAEDKDMEDLETLRNACNSSAAYTELKKVFANANAKYNSGLFASENWIDDLTIDNKILKDIANELYYPSCPYAWVALPVEVLGNIYEKFLGSEISFKNVKNGHTVTVEEKPEIKKAGGVFYTPTYIVKYIVEQTIGKKLANCTPENAKSVTICDPACGSGSFLVGAFKYLLNWYLDQYSKNKTEENKNLKSGKLILTKHGIALSIQEKKRILTTHIYGVDIDAQAVEVTKLSLFLQMLEGDGKQENSLFRESDLHLLPHLGDNIKCGNSLIGSDFYATQDLSLFGEEAMFKVNAFDWEKEFPEIFGKDCHRSSILLTQNQEKVLDKKTSDNIISAVSSQQSAVSSQQSAVSSQQSAVSSQQRLSGFECVIGNPPYVRIQELEKSSPESKLYYEKNYQVAKSAYDLSYVFFEKAMNLISQSGNGGFIFPHKFFNSAATQIFRDYLVENTCIDRIAHFGANMVFDNADTYTCIAVFSRQKNEGFYFQKFPFKSDFKELLVTEENYSLLKYGELKETSDLYGNNQWIPFDNESSFGIFKKIYKNKETFGDVFKELFVGLQTSNDKLYVLTKTGENTYKVPLTEKEYELEQDLFKPFLFGRDVHRYCELSTNRYVFFPYTVENGQAQIIPIKVIKEKYPLTYNYLMENEKAFKARESGKAGKLEHWYAYLRENNLAKFEQTKLSSMEICSLCPNVTMNIDNFYHTTKVYSWIKKESVTAPYEYFMALANSSLFWWFLKLTGDTLQGDARTLKTNYIAPFPIPTATEAQQQELANLATLMMEAVKKQQSAISEQEKSICKMRVEAIDAQINAKVYALYGLTKEEIAFVEKS